MLQFEHVGITATQNGMSADQREAFARRIVELRPKFFHHGDCVGGDAQAHDIVRQLLPDCVIVGHPSNLEGKRAFKRCDELRPIKHPLVRNHDIVNEVGFLLVAPRTNKQVLRSGTWSTYRYAEKVNRASEVLRRVNWNL